MGLDGRWSEVCGWITSYSEEMVLRIWGFWKDCLVEFYRWKAWLSFSDLLRSYDLCLDRQRWIEILNTSRWAVRVGFQHSRVSIGFYECSLSLYRKRSKVEMKKLVRNACTCIIIIIDIYSQFMIIQNEQLI